MLSTLERVLLMQEFSLAQTLPSPALLELALVATEVEKPAGVLWSEGDPADAVYFVLAGTIGLQGAGPTLTTVSAGRDLGAIALIGGRRRTSTAVVLRPAMLLRVDCDDFFEVLGAHPDAARAVFHLLGTRLHHEIATADRGGG